jgi:hypothetical protein
MNEIGILEEILGTTGAERLLLEMIKEPLKRYRDDCASKEDEIVIKKIIPLFGIEMKAINGNKTIYNRNKKVD